MERSRFDRWVVFDLGEVLSESPSHLARIAQLLAAPAPEVLAAYWRHRAAYDEGGSGSDYWRAVGRDLGMTLDDVLRDRLIEVDSLGWTSLHEASEPLLREVKAAGFGLAMLSNLPRELAVRVRDQAWSELFDVLVFSCDVGVMKPDPAIYRIVQERVAADAGAVPFVFFDDRVENVDAAAVAGWRGHVWAGHDDARSVLARTGASSS